VTEIGVSLNTAQVAGQLGLSEVDVKRLIARGALAASLVADRIHVEPEDLKSCMKISKRWRVPGDLQTVDYAIERKARERWLEAASATVTNDQILADMRRQVRPGQPLETIASVVFNFNSAPPAFLQSLAEDSSRRDFKVRIKGEAEGPATSLGFAYVKSRLYSAANKIESRDLTLKGSFPAFLYGDRATYQAVTAEMVSRVQQELISSKETRLIEVETQRQQSGSDVQITVRRIPCIVTYLIPTSAVDSVLRVARVANDVF
jgi:hypothetical protein